ncbi:hypothetical protein GCM10009654_16810 [Streptomyces hebeiensis]|uniref:Uncharacterized protein n=1 Tax=Streptomyces hebeiensis TaxID=229486 RepID=A0ABN1UNZ3_9ACTN
MSLVKLIAQADERGLAASGLACLDRCLPLLSAEETDVLRPLWTGVVDGEQDWRARLVESREALDELRVGDPVDGGAGTADAGAAATADPGSADVGLMAVLVRTMLGSAPSDWAAEPLRTWADTCSVMSLELHQRLDAVGDGGSAGAAERLARCREDTVVVADAEDGAAGTDGIGPLVAGELRRQVKVLEILAETAGAPGVRRAMDVSTEGQRVLRAVVSRRARARS